MTFTLLVMGLAWLPSLTTAHSLVDPAVQLKDLLCAPKPVYSEPASLSNELSRLDPQALEYVYRAFKMHPKIQMLAESGYQLRRTLVESIGAEQQRRSGPLLPQILDVLDHSQLRAGPDRPPDRLLLENAHLSAMGIRDRRILANPANRDLGDRLNRRIEADLNANVRTGRSVPQWQGQAQHLINGKIIAELDTELRTAAVAGMEYSASPIVEDKWIDTPVRLTANKLKEFTVELHAPPLTLKPSQPDLPTLHERYTLKDTQGREWLLSEDSTFWPESAEYPFATMFAPDFYVRLPSHEGLPSLNHYYRYIQKLFVSQHLLLLQEWQKAVARIGANVNQNHLRRYLTDEDRRIEGYRSTDVIFGGLSAEPGTLGEIIQNLRWHFYVTDPNYWENRRVRALALNSPSFSFDVTRLRAPTRAEKTGYKPIVESFTSQALYDWRGPVTDYDFAFVPTTTRRARQLRLPAGARGNVVLKSLKGIVPERKTLDVPTPERSRLQRLRLWSKRKTLRPGRDFTLKRHADGSHRAHLKRDHAELNVEAQFRPSSYHPPRLTLPPIRPAKIGELIQAMEAIGERHISSTLKWLGSVQILNGHDIARVFANGALYSYYPESSESAPAGLFGRARAYLNPDGQLCYQCEQAAETLLRALKLVYADRPGLRFTIRHGHLREGSHMPDERHAVVEAWWHSVKVARFDSSPNAKDKRAPNSGYLAAQNAVVERGDWARILGQELDLVLADLPVEFKTLPLEHTPFLDLVQTLRRFLRAYPTLEVTSWKAALGAAVRRLDVASDMHSELARDRKYFKFMQFHFLMKARLTPVTDQIWEALNELETCAEQLRR